TAAASHVTLTGAMIELGAGTLLKGKRIRGGAGEVDVIADDTLDAAGVSIDVTRNARVRVTSGSTLRFVAGRVKGKGGTVTFSTPPGGTCDVTGTIFTNVTPVFEGCTAVG